MGEHAYIIAIARENGGDTQFFPHLSAVKKSIYAVAENDKGFIDQNMLTKNVSTVGGIERQTQQIAGR